MVGNVTGYFRSIVTVQSSWFAFSVGHDFRSVAYALTIKNKEAARGDAKMNAS